MIGNLLVAFAAFLLAAWLSPVLTDTFLASAAGSVAAAGAAIFPENLGDLSLSGWFVLLLWTVVLWVILRYIGIPFGFIRPRAERLSDTKPMRYFQGAFGEGLIFFACMFVGVIAISVIATGPQTVEDIKEIVDRRYEEFRETDQFSKIKQEAEEIAETLYPVNKRTAVFYDYGIEKLSALSDHYFTKCKDKENTLNLNQARVCVYVRELITRLDRNTDIISSYAELFDNLNKDLSVYERLKSTISENLWWVVIGSLFIFVIVRGFLQERGPIRAYQAFVEFLDQSRLGFGGAGRFTGLIEEWGFAYSSTKALFLGRSLFNPFLKIGLEDERHMLTIAGSRGGKGTCVIIPNLLKWSGSTVVIDPKGTNAAVTAEARRKMGQNVYVIDPFGITKEPKASFDPMGMLPANSDLIREKINLIADALVLRDTNTKDPHWDDGARSVLAGLIGHMHSDGMTHTLPELRALITLPPEKKIELWANMMMNTGAGGLPVDAANRIMGGADTPEIKGILSNADKHTEWLSSPIMRAALGSSSFRFQELKDKPTTIYLVIPMQYLETHNRFIRLFINLVIREFVEGGRAKIPTLLMIDEFLSLGHMAEVERAMSWTAGYNLFLWPFVQDFGTLKQLYGSKVNAFITNSRAVQVFAVDDEETNKFVSGRLGERPLANRLDITRSNEVMPLRKPSEVPLDIAAESGRQYIMRTGKPAMLLERVAYYNSLMFRGKFSPDPDYPKTEIKPWKMKV